MKLWKSAINKFRKSESRIPDEFSSWVKMSIQWIGLYSREMEDNVLHEFLVKKGIPENEAAEIIIFLPTAFCRRLLPEIEWKLEYFDFYSTNKQINRKFKDNGRYRVIEQVTERYFLLNSEKEIVLTISGRSPEFKSVIKLLENGSKPEDVEVSEPFIVRFEDEK